MRSLRASVAFGTGALLAGLLGGQAVLAQSPPASPAPAVASPSLATASASWVKVDAPQLETIDTVEHAVTSATEVVALGTRCDDEGVCRRVALATPDGIAWEERGPLPGDVEALGDLAADEGGLVVVGRDGEGDGAIWRSTDGGATWQKAGERAFEPGADGRPGRSPAGNAYEGTVLTVERGPSGLIAGGWLNSEDADRSAMWRSTDGSDWERLRLPGAMDRAGGVFDVAASDVAYVAVTASGVWRSADGRRWERAADQDDMPLAAVEATDAGFIGISVDGPVTSVWSAGPSGEDWQRQADDPALAGLSEARLRSLDELVTAVGSRADDRLTPTVWTLEPGAASIAEAVSAQDGVRLLDIVTVDGRLLVVGSDTRSDGTTAAAAWLRDEPPG